MKVTLRPHQSEALNVMNQNDIGQIIVPTGGGKTYIMIEDLKANLNNNVTVIVAPRILLAQQLCDDFITSIDEDLNVFHAHCLLYTSPSPRDRG